MAEKKWLSFSKGKPETEILVEWWKSLEKGGRRATLKRCAEAKDVIFTNYFSRLLNELGKTHKTSVEKLSAVAGVLAHVSHYDEHFSSAGGESKEGFGFNPFARQLGLPRDGGSGARVSGLRFRRLISRKRLDELYPAVIRAVRLIGNKADIPSLANSIYWWNDKVRKEWALEYYAVAEKEK